jgi:hypothetical protein
VKAGLPTKPDAKVKNERKRASFMVQDLKCLLNEKDIAASCPSLQRATSVI